jgi:hypothetical protein
MTEADMVDFSAAGRALGFDFGRTGVASADPANPGLGNDLRQRVQDELEEARKRRLLGLDPRQSGIGLPGTTAAGRSLFGLGSSIMGGMR